MNSTTLSDSLARIADRELELAATLLRSLAHRVRGDLSVITNDLAYLATLVEPNELERARSRCAAVASHFSALSSFPASSKLEIYRVEDVAALWSVSVEREFNRRAEIFADLRVARYAIKLLGELFGEWQGNLGVVPYDSQQVRCELSFSSPRILKRSYSSASTMVAAELGERLVVEGCLVDIALRDQNWPIHFYQEGKTFKANIIMQLAEEMKAHG